MEQTIEEEKPSAKTKVKRFAKECWRVLRGGHKKIVAIGSYAQENDESAEVAFVVSEEYQNMGIASYLLEKLEKIAKENNYKRFSASVLRENAAMLHVFKERYPQAKISQAGGSEVLIQMEFENRSQKNQSKSKGEAKV